MLEFLKSSKSIKEKIRKERRLSEEKLDHMIQQRQEEFSGLINEAAAAYSIAKEFGIEIESEVERSYLKIADLTLGMQDVNLKARVVRVFAPKEFEKEGKRGRVCNLLIRDASGDANLILWNKDVDLIEKGIVEKGDEVEVLDAYVKGDAENKEIQLGIGGQIIKTGVLEHKITKIGEIKNEMRDIDVVAMVIDVGAINVFERENKHGEVSSILIGDESGKLRLILWDSNAGLVKKVKPGDTLKVENAYSKKVTLGIELHANWRSRVIVNPKNIQPPKVEYKKIPRVEIKKLLENVECEISGKIKRLIDARGYEVCKKCEGLFISGVCKRCGNKEAKIRYVLSAFIEDGTGGVNAAFFDKNALKLLGIKEIAKDIEVKTIFDLKRNEVIGKELVLSGRALMNKNLNKLEFIVKGVI